MGDDVDNIRYQAFPQQLDQHTDFQAMVISPRIYSGVLTGAWLTSSARTSMKTLIDEIQNSYNVNLNKTSVTGYSIGGGVAYNLGLSYPSEFSSIVPVAGFFQDYTSLIVPVDICNLFGKYVSVYHAGVSDGTVNSSINPGLVNAINACGDPDSATITLVSGATHDSIDNLVFGNLNNSIYTYLKNNSL